MASIYDYGTDEDLETSEGINRICDKITEREVKIKIDVDRILFGFVYLRNFRKKSMKSWRQFC